MANETTVQTSCIQGNPDVDECRENIPPGVTDAVGTSKLKVQVGDVIGYSSPQPSGDNEPLSDTCTFSTPAPASSNGGVKSRISGLKSALTPILKYLNIGNKCPSPEPLNSTGGSCQNPKSDFSTGHYGRSLGDKDAPVCWLHDEYLPEITLLDVTCDSTMQITRNDSALPDSTPATPVKPWSVNSTFSTLQPSQLSCSTDINITAHKPDAQNRSVSPLQSRGSSSEAEKRATDQASPASKSTTETALVRNQNISAAKSGSLFDVRDTSFHSYSVQNSAGDTLTKTVDIPASLHAPERWLDDRYFPEITLLDVTHDSELSPAAERSSMEVTQDNPPVDSVKNRRPSSELSGQIVAEPVRLEIIQSEELSSTLTLTHTLNSFEEQSDKCVEENIMKVSLEATRDISMGSVLENSRSSPEPSGQKVVKSETSTEDTLETNPANVTRDISSSSDMSVQCIESQFSASDMQSNTSLKNVTTELHVKPVETANTVEANSKELPNSHNAALTDKVLPPPSPKTADSANGTFTIAETSNLNASTDLNTVAQMSCPQKRTLDFPPSTANSPKAESESTDQVSADFKNTTETSLVMNQNSSAGKASGLCEVHNATFDRHSLQKSSTHLGEASATSLCLQNNTFDSKPPSVQNGTITLSETSSSNSHQNTLDKPSPPKDNPTIGPKDSPAEVQSSELPKQNGTTTSTDPNTKMVVNPESTFEANSAVEVASGADRQDIKNHSHSTPPVTDALSALGHQNMDIVNNKANAFNLDDTLDLKVDSLVTSTPMTNCKVLHFSIEREEGKIIGAQKKLYTYGPSKPVGQGPSDVSSNIISDRKTFLTQPAAKSLLPPVKAASQLLKYKPASTLPGRCELLTSSMPMTRQRAQAEALRNTAASDAAQGTTGISGSYNLRTTTTGSKQPSSGLLRPQLSGIPSGIQRTATGLRPPCTRSNAPPTSSTDKLRGSTVTNPVTKASQAKKHPLTRGEALPTAKRKKMDAPLPSSTAEASTACCDTVNKAKNLKQPATKALPAKTQRDDAAVPVSTAETLTSCDAASRAKALKQPANMLTKPHGHGCAKCVVLQEQLKIKSEEIRRLKAELLKYNKQGEDC